MRDTSPSGTNIVTELGWYQSQTTNDQADYEMGIYSHDAVNDRPNALIASAITGQHTNANTEEWCRYTSLNISIDPETTYWVGMQVDSTTNTNYSCHTTTTGSNKNDVKLSQASLPSSWESSSATYERIIAFYALYAASGTTLTVAGSLSSAGALSRMIHVARTYSGELMEWTKQLFSGWRQYVFNSMAQNFSEGR